MLVFGTTYPFTSLSIFPSLAVTFHFFSIIRHLSFWSIQTELFRPSLFTSFSHLYQTGFTKRYLLITAGKTYHFEIQNPISAFHSYDSSKEQTLTPSPPPPPSPEPRQCYLQISLMSNGRLYFTCPCIGAPLRLKGQTTVLFYCT